MTGSPTRDWCVVGWQAEAERRSAAGRRKGPEAVTEQRRDTKRQRQIGTMESSVSWRLISASTGANLKRRMSLGMDGDSPPASDACGSQFACSDAHPDSECETAGLAA